MSLMTRVKVTSIVITLAVAAGVLAFRDEWGRPDPTSDINENVTVHAQWYPNRGTRPIQVNVYVEGVPVHEDHLVFSPWDWSVSVPKGAVVKASFLQAGPAGSLTCRIDRPNRLGEPRKLERAGGIDCFG